VFSVSPSASSWLRARETAPPTGGRPVLVRGPGLATGGAEVPELAGRHGSATVLEYDEARVPRVLEERRAPTRAAVCPRNASPDAATARASRPKADRCRRRVTPGHRGTGTR